jgi:hypothetical protein
MHHCKVAIRCRQAPSCPGVNVWTITGDHGTFSNCEAGGSFLGSDGGYCEGFNVSPSLPRQLLGQYVQTVMKAPLKFILIHSHIIWWHITPAVESVSLNSLRISQSLLQSTHYISISQDSTGRHTKYVTPLILPSQRSLEGKFHIIALR